jgi:hypothetical protein
MRPCSLPRSTAPTKGRAATGSSSFLPMRPRFLNAALGCCASSSPQPADGELPRLPEHGRARLEGEAPGRADGVATSPVRSACVVPTRPHASNPRAECARSLPGRVKCLRVSAMPRAGFESDSSHLLRSACRHVRCTCDRWESMKRPPAWRARHE